MELEVMHGLPRRGHVGSLPVCRMVEVLESEERGKQRPGELACVGDVVLWPYLSMIRSIMTNSSRAPYT